MPVVHITSEAQFNEELANNKYCVVDFFATWCGPCKRIAPELEKLSNSDDFKNIKFLKVSTLFCNYLLSSLFLFRSRYSSCQWVSYDGQVDVDEQSEVAQAQNIEAMPTMKFFRDGKKGEEDVVGADLEDLKKKLKSLTSKWAA